MRIIDGHSHIGHDIGCIPATLDGYLDVAKKEGITDALLMPVPNQIYQEDDQEKLFLRWIYEQGKIVYYSDYYKDSLENPYRITNEKLYQQLKNDNSNVNLYFIPLIHPILDSYEYLDYIKKRYNPIAVKIHGLAAGVYPKMLLDNPDAIKKLQMLNLPIIVHTDYMFYKPNEFDIRNVNDAIDWCKLFNTYGIKGYITHCARFEPESMKLINESDNLVLAIGPNKLLSYAYSEMYRKFKDEKELLSELKKIINTNKVLYDVDYNWNYQVDGRMDLLDTNTSVRVSEIFMEDAPKVLSKNAERFFRL